MQTLEANSSQSWQGRLPGESGEWPSPLRGHYDRWRRHPLWKSLRKNHAEGRFCQESSSSFSQGMLSFQQSFQRASLDPWHQYCQETPDMQIPGRWPGPQSAGKGGGGEMWVSTSPPGLSDASSFGDHCLRWWARQGSKMTF